jgi:RNA polymerase sigma-70 factor (ECF subfamily)
MTSDWDYFDRARNGDENSWNLLFNRYYKLLLNICLFITGSIDVAKDLTQESFIRMIKAKVKHREGSFKNYISTIAFRLALKEKDHLKRNINLENLNIPDETSSPHELVIKTEREKYLVRIIESLPEHQKEILILRLYGEESYEDIARLMNLPLGTVKSRIFYAVKFCREKLIEKGIIE